MTANYPIVGEMHKTEGGQWEVWDGADWAPLLMPEDVLADSIRSSRPIGPLQSRMLAAFLVKELEKHGWYFTRTKEGE